MKRRPRITAALAILLWSWPVPAQPHKSILLPTGRTATKVREIQSKLALELNRETLEKDRAQHQEQFEQLKKIVTAFVIAQLSAEPAIEWWELRSQLAQVLGTRHDARYDERNPDHFHEPPYVFRVPRSGNQGSDVWALAYTADAFFGLGGSRVVVESYVSENGKARLAGRGGSEMDAYELKAEQVWNPSANSTSILIHGILMWASGHELPAAATLYGIGPTGVRKLWTFASPGIRVLGADGNCFVIQYHDEQRHAQNLPSTAVDVYYVGPNDAVPLRAVHHFEVVPKQ